MFGYGREHHFEYLAMELLGPCLWEKIGGEGTRTVLQLRTVVRLGQQLVRPRIYFAYGFEFEFGAISSCCVFLLTGRRK